MLWVDIDDDQAAVRDLATDLANRVVAPAARDAEATRRVPEAVWSALFDTGLLAPALEANGGGGVPDAVTCAVAIEALAHGDAGITMAAVWSGAPALVLSLAGAPAQQKAWLPRLIGSAEGRGSVALYEGFGRSPSEFVTTFTRRPGGWHVCGAKTAVAFADRADALVVVGTDASDGRLRAAILASPFPNGVAVAGAPEHGHLALDAAPTTRVAFDVDVTDDALVGGPEADGLALAIAVGRLRLAVAAAAIGTAARSAEYAATYANERIAFGKPIAAFQGVSFMLADAAIRLEAARLGVWDAASILDRVAGEEASRERAVTLAVNHATSVAAAVTRDGVQVLGGHGFIRDHPVELWYRSAAALACLDFDPTRSSFEPAL